MRFTFLFQQNIKFLNIKVSTLILD